MINLKIYIHILIDLVDNITPWTFIPTKSMYWLVLGGYHKPPSLPSQIST
jgi:hypothetical protein